MTFSTRNFDPLTPLAPKFANFATQILLFRLKHTVAVVTQAHVLQNFYTTWVQRLGPKLEGGWARGASKKIGTPYVFLQPLKATSNLVHNLVLGLAYQKTIFRTKIGGGLGQGSIRKKFRTPYVFLQPLKLAASNMVYKKEGEGKL